MCCLPTREQYLFSARFMMMVPDSTKWTWDLNRPRGRPSGLSESHRNRQSFGYLRSGPSPSSGRQGAHRGVLWCTLFPDNPTNPPRVPASTSWQESRAPSPPAALPVTRLSSKNLRSTPDFLSAASLRKVPPRNLGVGRSSTPLPHLLDLQMRKVLFLEYTETSIRGASTPPEPTTISSRCRGQPSPTFSRSLEQTEEAIWPACALEASVEPPPK